MYKITLYDHNCSPICDGIACFFVEELETFEEHWMNCTRVDEDQKLRFIRSKSGEIVTDYYSDDPELNIVQYDENAEILFENSYLLYDRTYTLYNTYDWETVLYAGEGCFHIRYIKFKDCYYLIGKYKLLGVCTQHHLHENKNSGWTECDVYGNPIFEVEYHWRKRWIDGKGLIRNDWTKKKYLNDRVETYCWVTLACYSTRDEFDLNELEVLSDEMLSDLMRDIPGEAG